MANISFGDVTLSMKADEWQEFRRFMKLAVNNLPIEYVKQYEDMLIDVGVGFAVQFRLYEEKETSELFS